MDRLVQKRKDLRTKERRREKLVLAWDLDTLRREAEDGTHVDDEPSHPWIGSIAPLRAEVLELVANGRLTQPLRQPPLGRRAPKHELLSIRLSEVLPQRLDHAGRFSKTFRSNTKCCGVA